MPEVNKDKLEVLLEDAKKAHGKYEKELGHIDEDWVSWYATYIVDRLNGTDIV